MNIVSSILYNSLNFLKDLPPLKDDEEYVSYDVEYLFTNIPLKETIDYILEQIYVHNKLPMIRSKLIFRRLLEKITRENLFQLNSKFFKQTDGCVMGGPLSLLYYQISGWSKWKITS